MEPSCNKDVDVYFRDWEPGLIWFWRVSIPPILATFVVAGWHLDGGELPYLLLQVLTGKCWHPSHLLSSISIYVQCEWCHKITLIIGNSNWMRGRVYSVYTSSCVCAHWYTRVCALMKIKRASCTYRVLCFFGEILDRTPGVQDPEPETGKSWLKIIIADDLHVINFQTGRPNY